MESKKLIVGNVDAMSSTTLDKVDEYLRTFNFGPKDKLHVRLLIEETLGMLKAMTGQYTAMLWIEPAQKDCRLHVTATADMDINKKKELIAVSNSGKNAFAKGFMAKMGDLIENGILNYENVMLLQQKYGMGYVDVASMGGNPSDIMFTWSLDEYRKKLGDQKDGNEHAAAAWDELEKSIVANIAKNITVGVKKDHVEMVIDKDLLGE
ncbi:MAG: hypothetical protein IJU25_04390 [Lachnospiraceae bacterium]|nr:hypothetical protein [Lachnospiraceae bacterium]MCR5267654.1 hypothetical protein [Lachnospiraceae bacterium]